MPRERHLVTALGLGAVVGYLLGHRHHPIVLWTLAMGLLVLSTLLFALWPWFLGAGTVVLVGHLHSRGWSATQMAAGAITLMLAAGVVTLVVVELGLGPRLLAAAGVLVAWRTWGQRWLARL